MSAVLNARVFSRVADPIDLAVAAMEADPQKIIMSKSRLKKMNLQVGQKIKVTGLSHKDLVFELEIIGKAKREVTLTGDLVKTLPTIRSYNALLVLKFQSGGIAHCELSWTTQGGLDLRNEVHGSLGSIFTDVTRSTPIVSFTPKAAGYVIEKADIDFGWTRPLPEEAFAYGYQAEMRHFVDCARNGRQPRETYEDGYIVNCILDAGYQSMRSKKWVRVKY